MNRPDGRLSRPILLRSSDSNMGRLAVNDAKNRLFRLQMGIRNCTDSIAEGVEGIKLLCDGSFLEVLRSRDNLSRNQRVVGRKHGATLHLVLVRESKWKELNLKVSL
jgi:hypothetical protein